MVSHTKGNPDELAKALDVLCDHFGGDLVVAGKAGDGYMTMMAPGLDNKQALLILLQATAGKGKEVLDG